MKPKGRPSLVLWTSMLLGVLILLWPAGRLRALLLSGGTLSMPFPGFAAAGNGQPASGGTLSLTSTLGGGAVTPMAGGSIQVTPGVIATQPAASANLDTAHAFPIPFKPSSGHDRITFRGLTANAKVRIYTISGQLVKELVKNDPSTNDLVWFPVANAAGQTVASGVYFYTIQGDSQKATGKIMIIK